MTLDKEILLSLLRLATAGPVRKELLAKDAKVPMQTAEQLLRKLSQSNFFQEHEGVIATSPSQRVKIALHALSKGADFERVCALLSWSEFESIAALAFEANGYRVMKNFRFKQALRKWEIDIVGFKRPVILCADCKHWTRGWRRAATVRAVEAQIERTQAFAYALPNYCRKAKLTKWETATLIPLVLSLVPGPYKFHNNVPVVPILQLQDFISGLPFEANSLIHLTIKNLRLNHNLTEFSKK